LRAAGAAVALLVLGGTPMQGRAGTPAAVAPASDIITVARGGRVTLTDGTAVAFGPNVVARDVAVTAREVGLAPDAVRNEQFQTFGPEIVLAFQPPEDVPADEEATPRPPPILLPLTGRMTVSGPNAKWLAAAGYQELAAFRFPQIGVDLATIVVRRANEWSALLEVSSALRDQLDAGRSVRVFLTRAPM
jgi:hypothetical protein